ncbi:group I truncated hemoglobin [Haloplanus halobius]|uniref:group I truncated hemoglobin n=1 Tax=Haloplanus halobius TaxID=2934938 RepID=UPI00200E268E|nr:group 1 truncated hemoglobin [Haloplanus sp. XH21]
MSSADSLYTKIGGREAVEAVVSDFYDRVFEDPNLKPYFEGTDKDALYAHQVQFISAVTGGPVSYDGDDMQQAHEGMGITEEDFDRVATYLAEALEANGVAEDNAEAILGQVASLKPEVVEQ